VIQTEYTEKHKHMKIRKKKKPHQCQCATCRDATQSDEAKEHQAINKVISLLHEKGRRQFVGLLALQWGRGSIERLSVITGLSRPTIRRGRDEVQRKERPTERNRVRKSGAGRKRVEKNIPRS
jgi:hypothetical protein